MDQMCSVTDCGRPAQRAGMCRGHRRQVLRGEEPQPIAKRVHVNKGRTCTFDGCGRPAYSHGLCNSHNHQRLRGDALYPVGDTATAKAKRSAAWGNLTAEQRERRLAGMRATTYERTEDWSRRMSAIMRAKHDAGFTRTERECIGCGVRYTPASNRQVWCAVRCRRNHARALAYGITQAQLNALYAEQNDACAICKRSDKPLQIDHSHTTGNVRGLLCAACNSGIGKLGDDPDRLAIAMEYILTRP